MVGSSRPREETVGTKIADGDGSLASLEQTEVVPHTREDKHDKTADDDCESSDPVLRQGFWVLVRRDTLLEFDVVAFSLRDELVVRRAYLIRLFVCDLTVSAELEQCLFFCPFASKKRAFWSAEGWVDAFLERKGCTE